jgi:hypothetical protein
MRVLTCRVPVQLLHLTVRTSTAMSTLGKTARVRKCHLTVQMSEPHASGHKRRSVRTLHTENLKLEKNLQKNIFFLKIASEQTCISSQIAFQKYAKI